MKKMKYLRTWLVVALVVTIIGSLTGGTVAWFTDNVEVANNVIQSGTLDIDIELKDDVNWISLEKDPETKIFDYNLWEPGYTQVETMKIINRGNLALEYILNVQAPTAEVFTVDGENKTLANAIDVYMSFGEFEPTADNAADTRAAFKAAKAAENGVSGSWWYAGNLAELMVKEEGFTQGKMLPSDKTEAPDGVLESGLMQGECTCTIALHMQEEAGNEYQNRSLGNVGFVLKAKQFMYEEDSFDETYDKDAVYGEGSVISNLPKAMVNLMPEENLPTEMPIYNIQSFNKTGETVALDIGYIFQTTETPEEAALNPYANWHADYVVTFNDEIAMDSCGLAGQYDFWDMDWIAFKNPINATKGKQVRLLKDSKGIQFNYVDLCREVQTFNCGVFNLDDNNVGKSITVQLCLFEPDPEDVGMNNTNNEGETGRSITLATYVYTFEPVQDANK